MRPRKNQDPEEIRQLRETIGGRARAVRTARALIQVEVAEHAEVTSEFYARIERGHALPSIRTLYRLCVILDVSADSLLGLAEMPALDEISRNAAPRGNRQEQRAKNIARLLRSASPKTLRVVTWVLRELDRAARSSRSSTSTSTTAETSPIPSDEAQTRTP